MHPWKFGEGNHFLFYHKENCRYMYEPNPDAFAYVKDGDYICPIFLSEIESGNNTTKNDKHVNAFLYFINFPSIKRSDLYL